MKLTIKKQLKNFWVILDGEQKREFLILLPLITAGAMLEAFSIGMLLPTLVVLIGKANSSQVLIEYIFSIGIQKKYIIVIAMALFMIVFVIKVIYISYINWRQSCFSYDVTEKLSSRMINKYMHQQFDGHNNSKTSIMLRNIIEEVGLFTGTGLQPMLIVATEAITALMLISLLFYVDINSTLLTLIIVILFGFSYEKIARTHITKLGQDRKKYDEARTFAASQSLQGFKDILINNKIEFFIGKFNEANLSSSKVGRRQYFLGQMPRLILELIAASILIAFILLNTLNENDLTEIIPVLAIFSFCAFKLMPSVNRILASIQAMQYGIPALDVISSELSKSYEDKLSRETEIKIKFKEHLKLQNITFRHNSKVLLNKLKGIIGKSGSGKSTLIDLILGLYVPEAGSVSVDENNVTRQLGNLRDSIGYVPQSIFLLDDSIKNNIAFGVQESEISNEKVMSACKVANLEDLLDGLECGIETQIGERGVRLSGGQRQRIGIARALYRDPEIIIFDEATSALDSATEQSVIETIEKLMGQKTIVMIAHRTTTLKSCDYIYELHNGNLNKLKGGGFKDEVQR